MCTTTTCPQRHTHTQLRINRTVLLWRCFFCRLRGRSFAVYRIVGKEHKATRKYTTKTKYNLAIRKMWSRVDLLWRFANIYAIQLDIAYNVIHGYEGNKKKNIAFHWNWASDKCNSMVKWITQLQCNNIYIYIYHTFAAVIVYNIYINPYPSYMSVLLYNSA